MNDIEKTLRSLEVGDTALVALKPILASTSNGTIEVQEPWRWTDESGRTYWQDADAEKIYSSLTVDSMNGVALAMTVQTVMGDGKVRFIIDAAGPLDEDNDRGENITLSAEYVAGIVSMTVTVQVDGLQWPMRLLPGGGVRVGCQEITPAGAIAAFKALGEHLGYDVED